MEDVSEIRTLIAKASHVLIPGHASPDGDCAGSMLALALAMRRLGKQHTLVLADPIPETLSFLPGVDRVLIAPAALPEADLALVPDCSDLERLGPLYDAHRPYFDALPIVNIDHHFSNRLFGVVNVVDPGAAAVCEQLFFLLPAMGVSLDIEIATCLLTGIVTDTQTFRTPNTSPRAMRAAADLADLGAPLAAIADSVYNSRSVATLRLWGFALRDLEEAQGVVWTHMNEEMLASSGATWDESDPLTSLLSSVVTARVSILFKEMPDGTVRVSLRSRGALNVAVLAEEFEGGGHAGAAGCTVAGSYSAAKEKVVTRVIEALSSAMPGK